MNNFFLSLEIQNMANIQHFDVFLSYNWKTKPYVRKLYAYLTNAHKLKVWIDDEQLFNNFLFEQLGKAIKSSKCFVCCITNEYSESDNCQRELSYANALKKPIIVLMIENLHINEMNPGVGILIGPLLRFNVYKEISASNVFDSHGKILSDAVKSIQHVLDQGQSYTPKHHDHQNDDTCAFKMVKNLTCDFLIENKQKFKNFACKTLKYMEN